MSTIIRIVTRVHLVFIVFILVLAGFLAADMATAQTASGREAAKEGELTAQPEEKVKKPVGPADEFNRGVPLTTVKGFFSATGEGDYERAAKYLDLSNLPRWMSKSQGPQLARQLKIALDRANFWIDLDLVSGDPKGHLEDGLPANRDSLGRIKTPEKIVDIQLRRVRRDDGIFIWKFSNRTVAQIPHLYKHFGYSRFEQALSKIFPDLTFFGWQTWQWALFLGFALLAYLVALVLTWLTAGFIRRRQTDLSNQLADIITGPVRILIWLVFVYAGAEIVGPSVTIRGWLRAGLLLIIAFTWAALKLTDFFREYLAERFRITGQESAIVLLGPLSTFTKIALVLIAGLFFLDNIGFKVSTILASLGVGGIAVALAAQDTIKNFLGSIMILLDKPYHVGQRIVVKGHDGIVEEIGLRSTKMRLLTGHQTTVPNEEMARIDIENIGRRPHIRRLTNIAIPYDTPVEKVERAVQIIEDILKDHEGMDSEFPPRVYFNEFNRDSLNIIILYWYHPPAYWDFLALNQRVNTQIMKEFEKEGIKFAFPTTTTHLARDDQQPFEISVAGDTQLPG